MDQEYANQELIAIGEMARLTGQNVSAIRFYEDKGLIEPVRTSGNQRRYLKSDVERVSFIQIVQKLGLSLTQIDWVMRDLPRGRALTPEDWQSINKAVRAVIDARIGSLERLREQFDGTHSAFPQLGDTIDDQSVSLAKDNFAQKDRANVLATRTDI